MTWKAALEWARKERDRYVEYNTNLWDKIDRELEDK
ncbi:hypothetical protein LCGC14_1117500 [marine sediment metagenome]|uniref:Uncharacterized protein n=1 Tax=marine sediment metagenome TaxID=412755 RepID=A0A0F9QAT4_9ZZZZ